MEEKIKAKFEKKLKKTKKGKRSFSNSVQLLTDSIIEELEDLDKRISKLEK